MNDCCLCEPTTYDAVQVGGLCGHQAGVTCITAKGDGHHFISNGKDQTMKLWDIRKMLDPGDAKMVKAANIPNWCGTVCTRSFYYLVGYLVGRWV